MSAFDPAALMDTEVEGASSTRQIPFPQGEYEATVKSVDVNTVGQDNRPVFDLIWVSNDPSALAEMKREADATVRQRIFLDVTDEGSLDMSEGQNVQLGRLRAALDQNDPSKRWSPRDMEGHTAIVRVDHREYEGNIYAEVKGVASA